MKRGLGLLALMGAAATMSCTDGVSPGDVERVTVQLTLQAPAAVSTVESTTLGLAFDRVDIYHVTVQDSVTGTTLLGDTLSVPPNQTQHDIDLVLPTSTVGLAVLVSIVGLDGAEELYRTSAYVRVQPVDDVTPVALEVRYTGPGIRGRLTNEAGAPLAGGEVVLWAGTSPVDTVATEPDGTYLFVGLTPRTYQVFPPVPPQGQYFCPLSRRLTILSASTSLIADFERSATPCIVELLILSGGDLGQASDTAIVAGLFANDPNVAVSTFFFVNRTPGLSVLRQYDAVLLFANGLFDQSLALGNEVEDYVQLGGNVVMATFYWQNRSDSGLDTPGWGALEAIDPFASGPGQTYQAATLGTVTTGDTETQDALVQGITTLTSTGFRGAVQAKTGTTVVANWSDGSPLIGYRILANGSRMVAVSLFPASGTAATGDVERLWQNVVLWAGAAGGPSN